MNLADASIAAEGFLLNLRVADLWKCYREWKDKGAEFLADPLDNGSTEWRCYTRDPDGYLIEVGQYSQMSIDRFLKFGR
jgi:hypothetical protein